MADVVINIPVTRIEYTLWLRSSYIALSQISEGGNPMITEFEFGDDQIDALRDFMEESTRMVSRLFSSRQGDVTGNPFEYNGLFLGINDSSYVVYRFNEYEPVLPQASVLKSQLEQDVKNAIYSHLSILWFNTKNKQDYVSYFRDRYEEIAKNIEKNLYLLHD